MKQKEGSRPLFCLVLSEIDPGDSSAASLQGGVAETLHLMHVAEFLADELTQDAVALTMQYTHFLDAQ